MRTMFQAAYESPYHVPVMAWIGCAVALALALVRRRLAPYAAILAVVCALDAWLTGAWTPLAQDSLAMSAAGVTFVIAGDFRWFVLLERAARTKTTLAGLLTALGLAFIVPGLAQIARAAGLSNMRKTFLAYELAFFALAIVMRAAVLPRRLPASGAWRTFALRMTAFEIAQYGLWATADILLLATNADAAYLLRMVPNSMYYTLFLIAAVALAPAEDG
jgi:hypothetical protein